MTAIPLRLQTEYEFADETLILDNSLDNSLKEIFTAPAKHRILRRWRRFLDSGFRYDFFTEDVFEQLRRFCNFNLHQEQRQFWHNYFDSDIDRLLVFIRQFGSPGRRSAEGEQDASWLRGAASADLIAAMCDEMTPLHDSLTGILAEMVAQHNALSQEWLEFANRSGIPIHAPPPYQVDKNSRNLLAYAARIARRPPPLPGLQTMFTTEHYY